MDTCRLCALATTDGTSVFSSRREFTLADMVYSVTAVKIQTNDQLSSLVCADCVELTMDAFRYVQRVRETNELLRKSLPVLTEHKEVEPEPKVVQEENCEEHEPVPECKPEESGVSIPLEEPDETSNETPEQTSSESEQSQMEFVVEYLDEPEAASNTLIELLIESANDSEAEKWVKLKQNPNYAAVIEDVDIFSAVDAEEDSSDEEDIFDFEPVESNVKREGEEQNVRCCSRKCKLVFQTREDLVKHGSEIHTRNKRNANADLPFECVICFQRFEARKNLFCHLRRLIRDYRCRICNIYLDSSRERTIHMKEYKHRQKPVRKQVRKPMISYRLEDFPTKICCGCEAHFETTEELFQHGQDYHLGQNSTTAPDGREHQCNICYKFFKSSTTLRNHQVLVYKQKTYCCSTCGKAFECPSKLRNHEAIHVTERNFVCPHCNGTFKTSNDLKGHQRIHQEKTLICNECGFRFHTQSQLKSHLKTHDDNAYDYACSFCQKRFKVKSNWKTHLKVHTKERPYRCEYCPKEFRYATDRKRHQMSHTGEYPHHCANCGKVFARGSQLSIHARVCGRKEK